MFWSKRLESRSDLYNPTHKNQIQQQSSTVPRRTSLSANSSPRQPFVLLDPLDPQASQSSLAAAADEMPLSSNPSSSDTDSAAVKHSISRQIVNRDAIDSRPIQSTASTQASRRPQPDQARRNSVPHPHSPPTNNYASSSGPTADPLGTDLYTINSLNSFSFGAVQPQSSSSSSRSVGPLSPARDDPDNRSEDFIAPTDVTPRPSVVAYHHQSENQNYFRSHPTQPPGQQGWPPTPVSPSSPGGRPRAGADRDRIRDRRGRDSDTSSYHTFGTSSASASVTSLSDHSTAFSRTGSIASRHTDTTNQTSTHDLSSTDDEEDHHHPIPPNLAGDLSHVPRNSARAESSGTGTAVEFSSDEEYDDSEFDYDDYTDEDGLNIEIGSAQYEGSVVTHDWERELYSNPASGSGSVRAYSGSSVRRGSLPMAIPGAAPPGTASGRDRENSVITLRRPSRSLDDEIRNFAGRNLGHNSGQGNAQGALDRPLPPAPVSVPESDGDWRTLQERSTMKGKGREQQYDPLTSGAGSGATRYHPNSDPTSENAMDGFDLDWSNMIGGIVSFDPSEVAGIIRPIGSADTNERRPSAISHRWLLSWGNNRRPSVTSNYGGDSFGKAVRKWGGDEYQAQRRDWSFRREKADQGAVIPAGGSELSARRASNGFRSPRESIAAEMSAIVPVNAVDRDRERGRELESAKFMDKDKAKKASVWQGMVLDSQEVWKNDLVGRFKVDRNATIPTDPAKGPQQRLVVTHFRDPFVAVKMPHNGPPVTIHKHSKAVAFSISRHYKPRPPPNVSRDGAQASGTRQGSSQGDSRTASRNGHIINTTGGQATTTSTKKSSSMILLAPRRVQVAFTSTTTTRKLESHGLLDDDRTGTGSESRERDRARRNKEREKEKEKERQKEKEREKRKKAEESKAKGKGRQARDDSTIATSSSGSITSGSTLIASTSTAPPPSSAPSLHTYPPGSTTSLNSSSSREPTFEDHAISRESSLASRRRRRIRDPLDVSDDDDDDPRPTRTPHSEAYGTVDASIIEQIRPRHDRLHGDHDPNGGFLKRVFRGRTNHPPPGPSNGQRPSNFEPPWMTMASRNKQEQQQRVVDNLNTSFKDVGLLPSTHKDKPKHGSQKAKKISSGSSNSVDIFEDVPPESLYMLLPLWPGSTDPVSERKGGSYVKPVIPNEQRQYLLVYYKVPLDTSDEKIGEPESKKRSRNSPTSSHDSQTKRDDQRATILLSTFHISARLVSYKDLQGSGVRVPDEGLSVAGPLEVAFRSMPTPVRDEGLFEFVLGVCHSREAGIEFYPDGLIKMGLCLQTSEPVQILQSEEDEPPEPDVELTPLGRAVLEMAWLGAMALTSFGTAGLTS
ncbi:hypothetical protein BDZ94DRAFT_1236889 [Collybia nuda]|uniref:Uncharacterized protein n=1 Tax=Collybia nuda TaxID=64659 RepID=A0A9P5Y549_9AGAR|nr:hypothetical protein BDZ94DRAFT_1236889 [Collybia nuda]